jgi:hypothetical protein
MKTVKYKAAKNCKVKIKGVYYSGDKVLPPDMDEAEIKRLLAAKFIQKITLDEGNEPDENTGTGSGNENDANTGNDPNPGNENNTGNENENPGGKTLDEMDKKELKAEAKRLGVEFGFGDSEDEIRQKIKTAQGAGV